jgi:hypothetical protein
MMKVVAEGIAYRLNFAGYDVSKTEALIEKLKTKLADNITLQVIRGP